MNQENGVEEAPETIADRIMEFLAGYAPSVIGALLTLIIGYVIAKTIRGIVRKVMNSRNVDATLTSFITSILYLLLMTVVVISALGRLGVETTSAIAVIGAAGLAIGFALQGSLSNFAAGIMLIVFRPFKAGDYVEAGGTSGTIKEIAIFSTTMMTPDNKKVVVPNGSITDGTITNFSAMDTRRVDMVFGIGYGDDLRKAKDVLEKILESDDRVLKDKEYVVAVSELGDSSVNFIVRPWVKTADYWAVYWDTHEKVKTEFDAAGISIPFPQRDVHLHQVA